MINQTVTKGDQVAYHTQRSNGHTVTQVRRIGVVQGWRNGLVIVAHKAGYTELVSESELYLIA
ncbi:hypothetical protein [Serratia microhaemolytica]|uniref:hypothetical protein n=1 Tax=Serratia microhaemolytica TaxID=2675110 RepID=UPI000FDE98EE|nr:hypothetical protein [Serratia microhaemolytica]